MSKGWAHRTPLHWFWSSHWDDFGGSLERDGPIRFVGNELVSQNRRYITMPCAVIDNFGDLVAIPFPPEFVGQVHDA